MSEQNGTEKREGAGTCASSRSDEEEQSLTNRRRLLRGGLGAAPLLLTLVSRPVLGGQWTTTVTGGGNTGQCKGQCFTPSGFVSMPTSQHGKPSYCSGYTPGYWKQKQHFDAWIGYYPIATTCGIKTCQATLFTEVFNPSPYEPPTTFLQVLELQGGPPNDVARHIVAAVLNVMAGRTPVLTVPVLQGIWTEYMSTGGGTVGYFEPTAGVKWYHDDIVNYLLSTQTL